MSKRAHGRRTEREFVPDDPISEAAAARRDVIVGGYHPDGVSEFSHHARLARQPKIMTTAEGALQQNLSRIGRLRAQLRTERNIQVRQQINEELDRRLRSPP